MECNMQSPSDDTSDARAEFRKPTNDAANRKYRRRSPAKASSSSEGTPSRHEPELSPVYPRDSDKGYERRFGRRDNEREMEIDSSRRQHGRSGDPYKHPDRTSSRRDHGYSRHDEYVRDDKLVDEDRLSSRSSRGSRSGTYADHSSDRERSRDYYQKVDKYLDDRYDGSRQRGKDKDSSLDHHRHRHQDLSDDLRGSSRRHGGSSKYESMDKDRRYHDRDGRNGKTDHPRDSGDNRSERKYSSEQVGRNQQRGKYNSVPTNEERKKFDEWETVKENDQSGKTQAGELGDKSNFSENQESASKKLKFVNFGKDTDCKDADEKDAYSEQAIESANRSSEVQAHVINTDASNDPIAAKVAALKAAELVNRSLAGGGGSYMTADQKKKLLWGNKKSTTAVEPSSRWDTALFDDRERQEKFNKLMGVKGEAKVERKPQGGSGLLEAEKQNQLQQDLEKQYTAGLRRRDGRTVGLGL